MESKCGYRQLEKQVSNGFACKEAKANLQKRNNNGGDDMFVQAAVA